MTNDNSDLLELIKKVITDQYFAVLASVGQGQPYTNLVAFVAAEDLKSVFFTTNRNTKKYENVKFEKRISLLIDNRQNRPADLKEAVAITVIGSAVEEPDPDSRLHKIFLMRHRSLKQFLSNADTALITVRVSEYIIAGFSKTQRIVFNSK